ADGGNGVGIHGVDDFLAVRRDIVIVGSAEREGGNATWAGRQILGGSSANRHDEQVTAAFALPGIPVSIQELGVDARFDFAGFLCVQVALVARFVGAAFGIDFAGEEEIFAVG